MTPSWVSGSRAHGAHDDHDDHDARDECLHRNALAGKRAALGVEGSGYRALEGVGSG